MPVIKPRTRGKHTVRTIARLDAENYQTLQAYAAFIQESPEYVLDQLIEVVLSKDKEFHAWRAQQAMRSGSGEQTNAVARPRRGRRELVSPDPDQIASPERAVATVGQDR